MAYSGAPVFVTYSFLETDELPTLAEYQPYTNNGYTSFNAQQRASFMLAAAEFEKVSGIKFIEVDDPANASIGIFNTSGSAWGGWANYGDATDWYSSNGYLIIDNASTTYAPGTVAFEILLHELGHSVGLKHPFDGDPTLVSSMDNDDYTLMSYTGNGINDTDLSSLDVDALNYLYGDSSAINGSWTWSWSDATSSFSLTGVGGNDTLIAVDADSTIFGLAGDDILFGRDGDDKLYGGAGNDILGGGSGNNELYGGSGDDWFLVASWNGYNTIYNGGSGIDTLDYSSLTWGQWVWLDDGVSGSSIIDIENLVGSIGNDNFRGNSQANRLYGGGGDDTLYGGSGDDVFEYWGSDAAHRDIGNDIITDFTQGQDVIAIYEFASINDISDINITTNGSGYAVITLGTGTITLNGILASQLTNADFSFGNTPPVMTIADLSLGENQWFNAYNLDFMVTDAEGDIITQYQFWDGGTAADSGYVWTASGGRQAANTAITVSAADILNNDVWLRGGASAGSETFWVRAYDGTDWSDWTSATLTTTGGVNTAPVTNIANQTLLANEWVRVNDLISYSDANGDAAVTYEFWDSGAASDSGYFWTPDNPQHNANVAITVDAADINDVWLRGGTSAGSETIWLRAFDGEDWSEWTSATLTTTGGAPRIASLVENDNFTYDELFASETYGLVDDLLIADDTSISNNDNDVFDVGYSGLFADDFAFA